MRMIFVFAVIIPVPPGCTSDSDCPSSEACINRVCRNPCNCGSNANCLVQNHRPICSCEAGFEGNPNIACHAGKMCGDVCVWVCVDNVSVKIICSVIQSNSFKTRVCLTNSDI